MITAIRSAGAGVLMPLALSGCIASYSISHEEPLAGAPDAAVVCRYNWTAEEAVFRSDNVYRYQWAPAHKFNHHLDGTVRNLPGTCPDTAAQGRADARISAHYLRYADAGARAAMMLPMAFAMGFTLGFVPVPLTDNFAVCLDLAASDGLRRRAIVKAQFSHVTNTWGSSNHRYRQGEDERKAKLDEAMREMTVHAWRKAWTAQNLGAPPAQGCAEALDALVSGAAPE